MIVRTNYRTWIEDRWFKAFLGGHARQIKDSVIGLIVSILSLVIVAMPYLVIEGITRGILKVTGKYKVK